MKSFCWIALCLAVGAANPLPKEFESLAAIINDEIPFVDAVRAFDRDQTALAKSEIKEADTLSGAENKDQAQAKYDQAQKRLDLIKEAYEWALQRYPENARLHNYYGELLYDYYKDVPAGLRQWYLALQSDPKLANAHNNVGIHLFHNGDYEQGLDHLEKALALEPKNPDFLFNMAQMYFIHNPQISEIKKYKTEKVYREGMKFSKEATENSPEDYELLQDYAMNFFTGENVGVKPDWKLAAQAWQAARAKARNSTDVFYTWLNEARVWIKNGNKESARGCLQEALTLSPNSDVVKNLLAELNAEKNGESSPPSVSDKRKSSRSFSKHGPRK